MAKSKLLGSTRYGLLAAACLILAFQASATRMLKIDERQMAIPGLHQLPPQIAQWNATGEQTMATATEQYLKPDEYIFRDYKNAQDGATINVFVAYFKSLQSKYGPHSPSVCMPGAGWLVTSSKIANIAVPGQAREFPVNEYTLEKSGQRLFMMYWYQNDRATWAREFEAKLRLLPDLVRYRRSDVSLIRLISPMDGLTPDKELARSVRFAQTIYPLLTERFASVH
jgi:EpsI family protein